RTRSSSETPSHAQTTPWTSQGSRSAHYLTQQENELGTDTSFHEVERAENEDGTVILTCSGCEWRTVAIHAKFVEALSNAHLLSREQWPYDHAPPPNWPNQ